MKIGIFIEPPKKNSYLIYKWKQIIKRKLGSQKYLTHPIHSTLAVFKFKKKIKKSFFKSLNKKKYSLKKFNLTITKPSIFYNDSLTKGNTLYFKIKNNKKLINLQRKILNHFQNIDSYIVRNQKFKNKKFNNNFKKYGFPFVGKDWMPHFTVASIKTKSKIKDEIIKEFLSQKIFYKSFKVTFFSIWIINRNKHKKILEIKLK